MSPVPGEAGRRVSLRGALRRAPAGRACPIIGATQPPTALRGYAASTSGCDCVGGRLGLRVERVFDAPGDRVDRLRVFADRVEGAVFAPASDVGDRLAADVEADGAEHAVGDAVDEDLGLLAAVLLVAETVCVGQFVGERADLLVGGSVGDDDLAALGVAPAAGPVLGEVADLDRVAELARRERSGGAIRWWWLSPVIGSAGGVSGTGCLPGSGSVIETSKTGTVRKKTFFSPVVSPCSSRSLTVTGARMRIALSPLRTQRLRSRKARKPAT